MAKLLFITQKIDKDDDILGVYHKWIEELSKVVTEINIICLYKGRSELPGNVKVFSLGKEKLSSADLRGLKRGFTRIKYVFRFYKCIWSLRQNYETVFVHMNPVYIILGAWFWKLKRKKIFLWYNHPLGNLSAKAAILFADKVFCTSPYSFSARYKKTSLMPVGVDTDFFRPMPEISKNNRQILYLGRISPIKKIEYLIEAAKILDHQGLDFKVMIVGSPSSSKVDKEYEIRLKKMSAGLLAKGKVEFRPAVSNHKTPEIYNSSGIFVNLTPTGSFDKTTLEAMACNLSVLVSNRYFESILPEYLKQECMFQENDPSSLALKIRKKIKFLPLKIDKTGERSCLFVKQNHSLSLLISKLTFSFDTCGYK